MTTDRFSSYASLEKDEEVTSPQTVVMNGKKSVRKLLSWVHIAISNAKRSILDVQRHKSRVPSDFTSTSSATSSTKVFQFQVL